MALLRRASTALLAAPSWRTSRQSDLHLRHRGLRHLAVTSNSFACCLASSALTSRNRLGKQVAVDSSATLHLRPLDYRILKLTPTGAISVFAGSGTFCSVPTSSCDDGPDPLQAELGQPGGLAVDSQDSLYIADTGVSKIRKVTQAGVVSTVAGDGTECPAPTGGCGDGLDARAAHLRFPRGVDVDSEGAVYIADSGDNKIRKVVGGAIGTIAGDGTACAAPTGACGDGPTARRPSCPRRATSPWTPRATCSSLTRPI